MNLPTTTDFTFLYDKGNHCQAYHVENHFKNSNMILPLLMACDCEYFIDLFW